MKKIVIIDVDNQPLDFDDDDDDDDLTELDFRFSESVTLGS